MRICIRRTCIVSVGLLREAESSFKSSLSEQDMVVTVLELAKVYEKLDLPNTALGSLTRCAEKNPGEVRLLVGLARIHEMLNDARKSSEIYARVCHRVVPKVAFSVMRPSLFTTPVSILGYVHGCFKCGSNFFSCGQPLLCRSTRGQGVCRSIICGPLCV
jgi:hypothetical protein